MPSRKRLSGVDSLKYDILVTYPIHRDAIDLLRRNANVETRESEQLLSENELASMVRGRDAVIIDGEPFTSKVIAAAERLRVIGRFGVGLERIDMAAATERGIPVTFTPSLSEAVADHTFALILAAARRVVEIDQAVKSGVWVTEPFLSHDVHGKTLGIIGLGRIGRAVARRAKGFDMRILYYDVVRRPELEREIGIEFVPLTRLLQESDFVSVHTPLTEQTRGLIGAKELSLMKRNAFIVNTSRGAIIDEKALIEALRSNKIAGAGLDVLSSEPPSPDNPLLKMSNVVITSHVASTTVDTRRRMAMEVAEDVLRVLNGRKPLFLANPEVLNIVKLAD
jgi:glyoxylate reductase